MRSPRTLPLALVASAILLSACGGDSGSSPTPTPTATPTPVAPVPSPPPTSKVVLGYYVAYDPAGSQASLASYFGYLNVVSATGFTVRTDGGITGTAPTALTSFAADHRIPVYACVTNNPNNFWDPQLAYAAIATNRAATVQSLVAVARGGGFAGINIDLEGIWRGGDIALDRAAFSGFIAALGPALHAQGLKLVISVPAKTRDDPGDTWSYTFDLAAIGAHADLIQLMTYDQHWQGGAPGPVAGRDWMEACIVFAKGKIPAAKLLTGLPAYGYDWDLDSPSANTSFAWAAIPSLLARTGATVQYEASSDSPFIAYTDSGGHRHQAWFENAQSIAVKSALVKKHGLAGLSMWRLGGEDLSFWAATRTGLD